MDHAHHAQHLAELAPPGFDLVAAFVVGLVGSLHCVGMCGPLTAIHARRPDAASFFLRYHLGRVAAYALVGLALGAAGGALPPLVAGLAAAAAGIVVVVVGLGLAGRSFGAPGVAVRLAAPVARLARALAERARHGRLGAALGLGAVHALLPCPLLAVAWGSALALGDPLRGTALMLAFGLGTVPALAATVAAAARLPVGRVGVQRFAGLGIAVWGGVLVGAGVGQLIAA